jgi:hypothetical protein
VDRLTFEVKGIDNKSKVEVVQPGKFKVEYIDHKSKVKVVQLGKFEVKEVNQQEIDRKVCGN